MLKIRNDLDQWKHRGRRNQEGFIEEKGKGRERGRGRRGRGERRGRRRKRKKKKGRREEGREEGWEWEEARLGRKGHRPLPTPNHLHAPGPPAQAAYGCSHIY